MTKRRTQSADATLLPYAAEKLGAAVQVLATHPSRVQHRLRAAAEHLVLVPVEALPLNVRRRFLKVMRRLTKHPGLLEYPELSRITLSVKGMHSDTAVKLAEAICRVADEVEFLLD